MKRLVDTEIKFKSDFLKTVFKVAIGKILEKVRCLI